MSGCDIYTRADSLMLKTSKAIKVNHCYEPDTYLLLHTGDQQGLALHYIGNSHGSQLGADIAGAHPDAYDSYVLASFTTIVQKGLAGVALTNSEPAQVVDQARFGTLPVGYLTNFSQQGRIDSFFGSHDQVDCIDTIAGLFYDCKDFMSVGQFLSVNAFPFNGKAFTGRVFTLDGEDDQPFVILAVLYRPCLLQRSTATDWRAFPVSPVYHRTVNKIGHAVQLHLRTPVLYATLTRFLAGRNFAGGAPL